MVKSVGISNVQPPVIGLTGQLIMHHMASSMASASAATPVGLRAKRSAYCT